MEVAIKPSNRSDKRFKAEYPNKTVHFGSKRGSTFIDRRDSETKANWKKRHIVTRIGVTMNQLVRLASISSGTKPQYVKAFGISIGVKGNLSSSWNGIS